MHSDFERERSRLAVTASRGGQGGGQGGATGGHQPRRADLSGNGRRMEEPPVVGATPGGGQFGPAEGPPRKGGEGKQGIRTLSLKQLKEYIVQIYESKVKFDQKCMDAHLPKEALEQHMYVEKRREEERREGKR